MAGSVRIGISGWRYKPWRGKFYPAGLAQKSELAFAAGKFSTVEINGTFYSLQTPKSFERWASETPEDFVFAVKGSRYITHMRRLRDIKAPLANFFASGLLSLGSKLGPLLWQFPPNFSFKPELLEPFFKMLPRDTGAAAALAKRHDDRVSGRVVMRSKIDLPLRHAIEIRHKSFVTAEFIELLREYNVALVCADTVEWPRLMDVTSDFVYCRLHGSEVLYASGYDHDSLWTWAKRVAAWASGEEPSDAERVLPPLGAADAALPSGPRSEAKVQKNARHHREVQPTESGEPWLASQAPSKVRAQSRIQNGTQSRPQWELKLEPRDVYVYFDNDIKVRAPVDALELIGNVGKLLPGSVVRARKEVEPIESR